MAGLPNRIVVMEEQFLEMVKKTTRSNISTPDHINGSDTPEISCGENTGHFSPNLTVGTAPDKFSELSSDANIIGLKFY